MIRKNLISYRGIRTQKQMAILYGVTQQAWSKWENGEATPSPYIMKKIEKDSGIIMEELFHDVFKNN